MRQFTAGSDSFDLCLAAAHLVRVAAGRARGMIGFTAIFGAALSGYAGVGVWAIVMAAIALVSLSQAQYGALYRRAHGLGLTEITHSTLLQSLLNALTATSVAYAFGWLIRLT